MSDKSTEALEQKCLMLMNQLKELEEKMDLGILDREDLDLVYRKLESKDALIKELEDQIENLKSGNDIEFESVNDDSNEVIALTSTIEMKNAEISELEDRIEQLNSLLKSDEEKSSALEKQVEELQCELSKVEEKKAEEAGLGMSKDDEINRLTGELASEKAEVERLTGVVGEKDSALEECRKEIEAKSALVREKVEELEAFKIEFGSIQELKKELQAEKRKNEELLEAQQEFEEAINDYECRLGSSSNKEEEDKSIEVNLNDVFPIIDDNTVLNARKLCYIREVGDCPWLEDFICYLAAKTKGDLQNTGIEPFFVILDDLSSDTRLLKYRDYDFSINALPSFGPAPESNITVTSYNCVPDLKAYLNISNHEFIVFVDRYGLSKPFVKRKGVTEYNLVTNSEMADLCKLPKDNSMIAMFEAKQLVNGVELPYDFALRGKRDRISLFLSKHSFEEVLANLKTGLFK